MEAMGFSTLVENIEELRNRIIACFGTIRNTSCILNLVSRVRDLISNICYSFSPIYFKQKRKKAREIERGIQKCLKYLCGVP